MRALQRREQGGMVPPEGVGELDSVWRRDKAETETEVSTKGPSSGLPRVWHVR